MANSLYVVNQFTTSIATLDVSDPRRRRTTVIAHEVVPRRVRQRHAQRDRRLGQIEFFTDVKKTT